MLYYPPDTSFIYYISRLVTASPLLAYLYNSPGDAPSHLLYAPLLYVPLGVPWSEAFFPGLVASRSFIPIITRDTLNHNEIPAFNVQNLRANSACDDFVLEVRPLATITTSCYYQQLLLPLTIITANLPLTTINPSYYYP